MSVRHYISCAEIADDFDVERENVHFSTSLKAFKKMLISKRYEIIAPRAYNSRIFMDTNNNDIYFYNGVTPEEVDELLTMLRKTAIAV